MVNSNKIEVDKNCEKIQEAITILINSMNNLTDTMQSIDNKVDSIADILKRAKSLNPEDCKEFQKTVKEFGAYIRQMGSNTAKLTKFYREMSS